MADTNIVLRIWRGQLSLPKTFWIVGFVGGIICLASVVIITLILGLILPPVTLGIAVFLTLMLLLVIYPLFALVSIIRAALIYKGRISWRISAVTAAIAMIGMPLIEMLLSLSNISISIKRH